MQGLYKLTFKDGSIYIGMTKDLGIRYSQHLRELTKKTHKNKNMQHCFNVYGPPIFEVIEVIEDYDALGRAERELIKKYDSDESIKLLNIHGTFVPPPKADTNKKYTEAQKLEALELFNHEFTGKEISEFTGIPVGTLYRWRFETPKSEQSDPKSEQISSKIIEDFEVEIAQIQTETKRLREEMDEILPFVRRQIKADNKRREESEQTGTFKFKRAGSI